MVACVCGFIAQPLAESDLNRVRIQGRLLPELGEDDGDNEYYEDGDNGDGDYPIRSHPDRRNKKNMSAGSCCVILEIGGRGKSHYLRAIPLNVLTLRST